MPSNEKMYSTTEASKILQVSVIRVRQFCQEGRIGRKVGERYVIFEKELLEFARKSRPRGRKLKKF
jgi:hypothetical protein